MACQTATVPRAERLGKKAGGMVPAQHELIDPTLYDLIVILFPEENPHDNNLIITKE